MLTLQNMRQACKQKICDADKIKSKLRGLFYNYFVIKEIGLAAGQNDIS